MSEKLPQLKKYIKARNTSYAILVFNMMLKGKEKEETVVETVQHLLLKISAQSGFLCWNQSFLLQRNLNLVSEIRNWIYNLIHYLNKDSNDYLYLPQLMSIMGSIEKPLAFFHNDNNIFLREEKIKYDMVTFFHAFRDNAYFMKLSFNIFYILCAELTETSQFNNCLDFYRYCILILGMQSVEVLWNVFRLYVQNNDQLSKNASFCEYFNRLKELASACEGNKYCSIHRNLIMTFGCVVIYRIKNQDQWLEHDGTSVTFGVAQVKAPSTSHIHFAEKFSVYSPLFNRRCNTGETYFEALRYYYDEYSKIDNFSVRNIVADYMEKEFPVDEYGIMNVKREDEMKNFQVDLIDPYLYRGYPDAPWENNIELVEKNYIIPGVYRINAGKDSESIVCGSFINDEVMFLNAWFHYFIVTDAPSEMMFRIEEGKFSRFYTIHSLLTLKEPISTLSIQNAEYINQILYYFIGMYIIGFPTFYYPNDIVIDANESIFFAGIFRKMRMDVSMARRQALLSMRALKVSDSLILEFVNNLKSELYKEKYEIYLKNSILNNLFSICKWKDYFDELLKEFSGEEL